MAEIEDCGIDMEDEEQFKRRVDEGLIKVRPPRENISKKNVDEQNQDICPVCESTDDPINPDHTIRWICCGRCKEWSHWSCVHIDFKNPPDDNAVWYCSFCSGFCPICNSIDDPSDQSNRVLVCDSCKQDYHLNCLSVDSKEADENGKWVCISCKEGQYSDAEEQEEQLEISPLQEPTKDSSKWKPDDSEELKLESFSLPETTGDSSEWNPDDSEEELKLGSSPLSETTGGFTRKSTRSTRGVHANKFSPSQDYQLPMQHSPGAATLNQLLQNEGLERKYLETYKDQQASFIFCTSDIATNPNLVVLISDVGNVKAGQWTREDTIKLNMSKGSQLPYIRKALNAGYGVIVLNPNYNFIRRGNRKLPIFGSATPLEHGVSVWQQFIAKSGVQQIFILAHSKGGDLAIDLAHTFHEDFINRVTSVLLIESTHRKLTGSKTVDDKLKRISVNYVQSENDIATLIPTEEGEIPKRSAGHKTEEILMSVIEPIFKIVEEKVNFKPLSPIFKSSKKIKKTSDKSSAKLYEVSVESKEKSKEKRGKKSLLSEVFSPLKQEPLSVCQERSLIEEVSSPEVLSTEELYPEDQLPSPNQVRKPLRSFKDQSPTLEYDSPKLHLRDIMPSTISHGLSDIEKDNENITPPPRQKINPSPLHKMPSPELHHIKEDISDQHITPPPIQNTSPFHEMTAPISPDVGHIKEHISDQNIILPNLSSLEANCSLCELFRIFLNEKLLRESLESSFDGDVKKQLCTLCATNTGEKVTYFLNLLEERITNIGIKPRDVTYINLHLNIMKITEIISEYHPAKSHEVGIMLISGIAGQYNWSKDERVYFTSVLSLYAPSLLPMSNKSTISVALGIGSTGCLLTKYFDICEEVQTQIELCDILWHLTKKVQIPRKLLFKRKFHVLKQFIVALEPSLKFDQTIRSFVIEQNETHRTSSKAKQHNRNDTLKLESTTFTDPNVQSAKSMYGENPTIEISYTRRSASIIVNVDKKLQVIQIPFEELTLKESTEKTFYLLTFTGGYFTVSVQNMSHLGIFLNSIKTEIAHIEMKDGSPKSCEDSNVHTENNQDLRVSSDDDSDDTQDGPKSATLEAGFFIKPEEWRKYWKNTNRRIDRTEAGRDFPLFYESPCLVLIGTTNHAKKIGSRKQSLPFCTATGTCTLCGATHKFKILESPYGDDLNENFSSVTKDIHVEVEVTGSFFGVEPDVKRPDHRGKNPQRRQLRGHERKLMGQLASKYGVNDTFYAQMAYRRSNEIEHNNYTSIRSATQISQAKYELDEGLRGGETLYKSTQNFKQSTKDEFSKVYDTKVSKQFPGLIRQIIEQPFSVQYWTFDQLKLTIKYFNNKNPENPTVVYLDFTGNIFYNKTNPNKAILNGGIVLPPRVKGNTPMVVAEWASERNQTRDVKTVLTSWSADLQVANNHVPVNPPGVVVIDISWNLLHAVTEAIIKTDVKAYLKRTYQYVNNAEPRFPFLTVLTFCTNHSLPAWVKKARDVGPNKIVADTFIAACLVLASCETWNEVKNLYDAIVKIFCSKFENKGAHKLLNEASKKQLGIELDSFTEEGNYVDSCLKDEVQSTMNDEMITSEMQFQHTSIRGESPFRSYFEAYRKNLMNEEEDIVEVDDNIWFAPNLVKWFDKNWMPLSPYFLRCFLPSDKNGNIVPLYTNSYVELWWQHEKEWYTDMSSSERWPWRIFLKYSNKIEDLTSAYELLGKNRYLKSSVPRQPKVDAQKEQKYTSEFQPSSQRGKGRGSGRANSSSRRSRIEETERDHLFTPRKASRSGKTWTNEKEKNASKSSESWSKKRGSDIKSSKKKDRYFSGEINLDHIKIPANKAKCNLNFENESGKNKIGKSNDCESFVKDVQHPKTIVVTGIDGGDYVVPNEDFNNLKQSQFFIDTTVMAAGISLFNRYLHCANPENSKVIPIDLLRLIWNSGQNFEDADIKNLGEYSVYLNGKKPFHIILPRRFETLDDDGNLVSDDCCHYTFVSSHYCTKNSVRVYETFPPFRKKDKTIFTNQGWDVITKLLGRKKGDSIKVILVDVEEQKENECGAISLALCYRLIFNGMMGPTLNSIINSRTHLANCLEQNQLRAFPVAQRTGEMSPSKVFDVLVEDWKLNEEEERKQRMG